MKTTLMLRVVSVLGAVVLSGSMAKDAAAAPQSITPPSTPLPITTLTGQVEIEQPLPQGCGDPVHALQNITGGRIDVVSKMVGDAVGVLTFDLTRLDLFLAPFEVHRVCNGIDVTVAFREIGLRLANAVVFTGREFDANGSGRYAFTIPKDAFMIYESILDNERGPQPKTLYQPPSADVIGVIDLRQHQVEFRQVTFSSDLQFSKACKGGRCLPDVTLTGTQTANVLGTDSCLAAPPTPLTVSCTVVDPLAQTFKVVADEGCNKAIAIHLGPYVVANGEVIKLQPTLRPGVRLLDSSRGGIRQFQVGPGSAIVIANDAVTKVRALCQ